MIKPPFPDQVFESFDEYIPASLIVNDEAWMFFDIKGRHCVSHSDFVRARDENTFPVWWVWPDQIPELVRRIAELEAKQKEDE